jgi:hypothetical protein
MIGKALSLPEGNKSNQRKYTDTLPRQFTMDYSPGFTYRITVWNQSDKYSSIIRSGGLRTRPRFAGTFTDISAAMVICWESKYKLEIYNTWARCMERSCDMGLNDQNEWWSLGTCTKSSMNIMAVTNMSLNDIIRVCQGSTSTKMQIYPNRYP